MTGFEWDPRKAASNIRKHGIRFADAVPVLEDARALTIRDDTHAEERSVTVGMDNLGRILTVVHEWREEAVRIISARIATASEQRQYLEN